MSPRRDDAAARPIARRTFLLGVGASVVATDLVLSACAGTPSSPYAGQLRYVALAAALENQAAWVYRSALSAAHSGGLGEVPPAFAAFAQAALDHHVDHAASWNALLRAARKPAVTGIPLSGQSAVASALSSAKTAAAAAALAARLENLAAGTFAALAAGDAGPAAIPVAAGIAPVEAAHAAILQFITGHYPVPESFIGATTGTGAVAVGELTA